jgi:hypothetical protein
VEVISSSLMERRVPFQVMLDPEQHHQLRSAAERRGQSIGSLVRESVARYLADVAVEDDPLLGIIGLGEDAGPRPHGDVATQHDSYLTDIVAIESTPVAQPKPQPGRNRRSPPAK